MTNTMAYQGYAARVTFDDANRIIAGRIAGIRDGVGFHADTGEGQRAGFHEAVGDYLETCAAVGKDPQRAWSGQMTLRVNPDVHRKAALAAELAGKSLNQWAAKVLGKAAG
jgi:predicted HicB family RNase H-like nuclease